MNLPQETREISSKQPHFIPKGNRERKTNPKVKKQKHENLSRNK